MKITKTVNLLKIIGITLITGYFSMFSNIAQAGTIKGSVHDFSKIVNADYTNGTAIGWSTGGEICVVCHTPHASDETVTLAPLWNHKVTGSTFTMYDSGTSSPSFDGTTEAVTNGVSVLCLSCHDGSVAIDSFGDTTGGDMIGDTDLATGSRNIGETSGGNGNLKNDHPISFVYTEDSTDAGMHPSSRSVTIGSGTRTNDGTIASEMLSGGKVQCTSCHDVHNNFVNAENYRLLKVSMQGSALCLTCHNK